ncbi:MAG: polysaccharide biosynthesis tyrosine autokinase [Bacteroidales bacterium]|nr:polysaccharide biosynthesis tyrosine autokinase [Bacteroidales bacterium]
MNDNQKEKILSQEEKVGLRPFFITVFRYWYFFALSVFLAVSTSYVYNKYSKSIYSGSATVLISDDKKSPSINTGSFFEGMNLFSKQKNIENEIGILQSYSLVNSTIKKLDLSVSYYCRKNFNDVELYKNSPFKVIYDTAESQAINAKFYVAFLSNNKFKIEAETDEITETYNFQNNKAEKFDNKFKLNGIYNCGELIKSKYYNFRIFRTKETDNIGLNEKCFFVFNSISSLTVRFMNDIQIKKINKDASIVNIGLEEYNTTKIMDFLNTLTEVYLAKNLEEKNMMATRTIDFIDNQLSEITDSLSFTEGKLQDFRTANKVMDVSFQAQKVFEKLQTMENERAILIVKSKYYNYLKDYIESNKNIKEIISPSAIGIEDQVLNGLLVELIRLYGEKVSVAYSTKQKNPISNTINLEIENIKNNIIENIQNSINSTEIAKGSINDRMKLIEAEIEKLPETERRLVSIERKFKLNDAIYTYLLQKRAEAAIAKASNVPDNKIIDEARITGKVSPKDKFNFIVALFLGLGLPFLIFFFVSYFNVKIIDRKQIENITEKPILGMVIHSNSKSPIVVLDSPKSRISESIRCIRTNLQFITKEKEKQTLLITSSLSGDGKSFCSINLASIFALMEKKTLLMGFDLRKPRLYTELGLSNNVGISNYLINRSELGEIIQKTQLKFLDVITAGPVPPNPSELIASEKTKQLFEHLKEIYDYIIIDTPPVGLITDAYLLTKYADVNLFIVRHNQTNKNVFESVFREFENTNASNIALVVNDVNVDKRVYGYGYRYAYGYGYGYNFSYNRGYGYYDDLKKKNGEKVKSFFLKKLFGS